ncbi:MAG TPA: haloacid dehalogenase-like hydrolase, partial [Bacilli bacterium]|nr:haloacid dehalogenase-like hydrolase [Bacilli bacterium]
EKTPVRRIPYRNIVYLGDGMTDIPMMILVKQNGGRSIAVYPRGKKEKVANLFDDGRVNYICVADYSSNSELEKVMKLIIDSIAVAWMLEKKEKSIITKKE